jgi:hypothetical protein
LTPPPSSRSQRAVDAIRRIAPAARALATACRVAGVGAAVAALALWAATGVRLLTSWPWGTAGAIVLALVLAVPALWLLHAAATLRDLAALPAVVTTRPDVTLVRRGELARLRHGGLRQLVRTVRTTVAEYGDLVGPWRAAVEVAAPWFWVWTGAAVVAGAVELLLVPVAALVAALT